MRLCATILLSVFSALLSLYPPLPDPGVSLQKSEVAGVVDIYYDGELVNNLVVIVPFDGHYNSSEIQESRVTLTADSIVYAPFIQCEPDQPASNACITLDYCIVGQTVKIHANQRIGLGLFFGVYQGVESISLPYGDLLYPAEIAATPYFELGHFDRYPASGFTLHSVYDLPDIYVRSLDGDRVDIETRNCPWRPEHDSLHSRLRAHTGSDFWFEGGIAFGSSFEVTLQPHGCGSNGAAQHQQLWVVPTWSYGLENGMQAGLQRR